MLLVGDRGKIENLSVCPEYTVTQYAASPSPLTLTCFQGYCADRNDLGLAGSRALAQALSRRFRAPVHTLGTARAPLLGHWAQELEAITPELLLLAQTLEQQMTGGLRPLTTMSRCAGALATLPVVARHRPEACVVWFDAHGDLNAPDTSESGYLGGMIITAAAGLWESGLGTGLTLEQVVLAGAHQLDPCEQALIDAGRVYHLPPDELSPGALSEAIHGRPVYIHLDCDVLSAGIVPSDYQVEGGLSLERLEALFEVLAQENVIGMEIAELESHWAGESAPADLTMFIEALTPVIETLQPANASCAL